MVTGKNPRMEQNHVSLSQQPWFYGMPDYQSYQYITSLFLSLGHLF